MNRYGTIAILVISALSGARAAVVTISDTWSAGSGSTTDNASYFGGGGATVTSLSLALSWVNDVSLYSCSNVATYSSCLLNSGNLSAMSASFSGTYNSNVSTFNVASNATSTQNAGSPAGGSWVHAEQNGSGSDIQWYVVGSGMLEAGEIISTQAYDSETDSVLDANFVNQVLQSTTGLTWFLSAPVQVSAPLYYQNPGDYFTQFGAESEGTATPEPATCGLLIGGLGLVTLLKRRSLPAAPRSS